MIGIKPYEIMLLIEPEVAEERHGEIIERVKSIIEKGPGSGAASSRGASAVSPTRSATRTKPGTTCSPSTLDAAPLAEAQRVLAITDGVMRFMAVNRVSGGSPARPDEAAASAPPVEATA